MVTGLGVFGTVEDLARNPNFAANQWSRYVNHRSGTCASFLYPYNTLSHHQTGAYASPPGTTITMVPLQSIISPTKLSAMLADLDSALTVYEGTPQETQIALQRSWLEDETIPQVEYVLVYSS